MNRAIWCVAPLIALFALIGCSSGNALGGKQRPEFVRTYASMSPGATEMLYAAGVPQQAIIGKTSSCNYPKTGGAIIVNGTTPNFEKILEIKPERVYVEKDLYGQATIDKLNELGLKTVVLEINSLESYEEALIQISKLAGTEIPAAEYIDKVYAGVSTYEASVKNGTKISVLTGNPQAGYLVLGKQSLIADLITKGKGDFVGPDSQKFDAVSIEQLIAWNPDVVVVPRDEKDALLADPAMKAVPAIAKRNVLGVDGDILLRNGGRVDKLLEGFAVGIGRIVDLGGVK